jgi:hypothetical protein
MPVAEFKTLKISGLYTDVCQIPIIEKSLKKLPSIVIGDDSNHFQLSKRFIK